MKIKKLKAKSYRNIEDSEINFSDGVNLLYGKNGAGKTNALEAIYLFAICKSFRTSKESDFVMHESLNSDIFLEYSSIFDQRDISHNMKISFFRNDRKKLYYQDVEITKISEFAGRFRAVFFTPDHLSLIKGSPDERRKFADMALCQIKSGYIRLLNEYFHILSQRNAMLRAAKLEGRKLNAELFDIYSVTLAEKAATITKQRACFADELEKTAAVFYSQISGEKEKLYIKYLCAEKENPKDFEAVKKRYISLYRDNIEQEIRHGSTKYGPHRDDLVFYIVKNEKENSEIYEKIRRDYDNAENEKEFSYSSDFAARTFASQGQQRTAVLALKLAEGEIIRELCGEYPVYLFDDVLSELDTERKKQLLSLFGDKQVIITCCDKNAFDKSFVNNEIEVAGGKYFVKK